MEMVSYWWSVVGFLAFVRGLLPTEAADALHRLLRSILDVYFLPYASFEVPEFDGPSINELYRNVQLHLTAKDLCRGARKTVLCKVKNSTNTTSTLAGNYEIFFLSSPKVMVEFWLFCVQPSIFGACFKLTIHLTLQSEIPDFAAILESVFKQNFTMFSVEFPQVEGWTSSKLGSDRKHFILVKSIALALLNI